MHQMRVDVLGVCGIIYRICDWLLCCPVPKRLDDVWTSTCGSAETVAIREITAQGNMKQICPERKCKYQKQPAKLSY